MAAGKRGSTDPLRQPPSVIMRKTSPSDRGMEDEDAAARRKRRKSIDFLVLQAGYEAAQRVGEPPEPQHAEVSERAFRRKAHDQEAHAKAEAALRAMFSDQGPADLTSDETAAAKAKYWTVYSTFPKLTEPKRAKRGPRPVERRGEPGLRETRKAMTVYFPPEVSKGLRAIALEEDTTLQALVGEAIDLLMLKRGKRPFGAR